MAHPSMLATEQRSPEWTFAILITVLIYMALIATLPQVIATWNGERSGAYGDQDLGLRLLRELVLLVIIMRALFWPPFWAEILRLPVAIFLSLVMIYVTAEIWYTLHLGYPLLVPLTGLRVFQYLPLAFIAAALTRLGHGDALIQHICAYLKFFVLIQLGFALSQAIWAPPLHGVSMLGGGRAFGTFVSPNLYGMAMAALTLLFAFSKQKTNRKWVGLCFIATVLSGSRSAMLLGGLVLAFRVFEGLKAWDRPLLVLSGPVLGAMALILVSSKTLSGREIALVQEGRLTIWQNVLGSSLKDAIDLLFGWGLGLGSNTLNVIAGLGQYPGQFDSDSLYLFILSGYGLVGLLLYGTVLWIGIRGAYRPEKVLVVVFVLLAGLPFNVWEYFFANAVLMILLGCAFAPQVTGRRSSGIKPALAVEQIWRQHPLYARNPLRWKV